ncbi:MAG: DUF4832 domain-containing protein, partial [Erysipelotrichaceae bacterium]|nr:DUF4832 domain-containing protein [Erysipelotrichaceae bacterium]
EELRKTEKHLIVRFLYDTDGHARDSEPEDIDIIYTHMDQLSDVLKENEDIIYTLQGLLIGNWGEMNGSRFASDNFPSLAQKLYEVIPENMFMAVRTPVQWRLITGYEDDLKLIRQSNDLERQLGLFNDGMMYSYTDLGTYGEDSDTDPGFYKTWSRERELDFQEKLCGSVPNGGEVVGDSEYSDLDNAIYNLSKMHVSYLNIDFDKRVFDKWENSLIKDEGIYKGIDGKKYITDHLGYRFVVSENQMNYDRRANRIDIQFSIRNVGFAPIYTDTKIKVRYVSENEEKIVELKSDLKELSGGLKNEIQKYETSIQLNELSRDDYDVYVYIEDEKGNEIICANTFYTPKKGIFLAKIVKKDELF